MTGWVAKGAPLVTKIVLGLAAALLAVSLVSSIAVNPSVARVSLRAATVTLDAALLLGILVYVVARQEVATGKALSFREAPAGSVCPSVAARAQAGELTNLGFSPVGEVESHARGKVRHTSIRYVAGSDRTVWASIDATSGQLALDSYWPSGSVVETCYPPLKINVDRLLPHNLDLQQTGAGVEAACRLHMAGVERRKAVEGLPYALPDLAAFNAFDTATSRAIADQGADFLRAAAAQRFFMAVAMAVMTWLAFFT